ncbi:hypothetical protein [Nocardioides sp. T2.26MG-1]|uniref:hypothetical protein n=1 Tax=Nocardioides sp. T2.26MG-1 TaxID=3041166 RepID=UPI00247788E7|nr:hypothetical protein [Nocardioides sp. T2.26MG-1]CAI9403831.1 hypothetical protein HIDPHFAB_04060 [Nocardioides sp. T2.26MG-1]
MMRGWHDGMMNGGFGAVWLFMGLFWVLLLGLIVVLVVRLLPAGDARSTRGAEPPAGGLPAGSTESPEQTLDRLFAVGEIDEQTYRSRRTALAEMRREQ